MNSRKKQNVIGSTGLTFGHTLIEWYAQGFTVFLPKLSTAMGLNAAQVGLIVSVNYFLAAISSPFLGIFSDIIGRKASTMALMVVWVVVGYLAVSFSPGYLWIVVLVALAELGSVAWHPPAMAIMAEQFPEKKGFAISIHSLGGAIAGALSPVCMGFLLIHLSWRVTLQVVSVPILLLTLPLWFLLKNVRSTTGSTASTSELFQEISRMKTNPSLIGILFVAGSNAMIRNALISMVPLYFAYSLNMNIGLIGIHMGILTLSGVIATPIMGVFSDKYGRKPVLATGMAFMGVAIIVMTTQTVVGIGLILSLISIGFFNQSLEPVHAATISDLTRKDVTATAMGILMASSGLMGAISPVVAGLTADTQGFQLAFIFVAATSFCAAGVSMFLRIPQTDKVKFGQTPYKGISK